MGYQKCLIACLYEMQNLMASVFAKKMFQIFLLIFTETNETQHEISNNVVFATSKASDQPAHTRSLIRAFASRLNIL